MTRKKRALVKYDYWGRILGRNQDKRLRSFPPCYSQSPLQLCLEIYISSNSRNLLQFPQSSYCTLLRRKKENCTFMSSASGSMFTNSVSPVFSEVNVSSIFCYLHWLTMSMDGSHAFRMHTQCVYSTYFLHGNQCGMHGLITISLPCPTISCWKEEAGKHTILIQFLGNMLQVKNLTIKKTLSNLYLKLKPGADWPRLGGKNPVILERVRSYRRQTEGCQVRSTFVNSTTLF